MYRCISWRLILSQFEFKEDNDNNPSQERANETAKNPLHGSGEKNIPFPSISNKVETFYFYTENVTSFSA